MIRHALIAAAFPACLAAWPAAAQDEEETTDGWDGSVELSAAGASGNSESLNAGIGFEAKNIIGRYTHLLKGGFNYARSEGVESQNNIVLSYDLDMQLRDRTYAFGRVQYDRDEFSGFENRVFLGGGVGHFMIEEEGHSWKLEAGPGFRYASLEAPDPVPAGFEETTSEFAVYASSEYERLIREGVSFSHLFDATYTDANTSMKSVAALKTALTETLSCKLSYEVRYETDPPEGKENTDTLTKASLALAF